MLPGCVLATRSRHGRLIPTVALEGADLYFEAPDMFNKAMINFLIESGIGD